MNIAFYNDFNCDFHINNQRRIKERIHPNSSVFQRVKCTTRLRAPAFLQRSLDRRTRQAHQVAADADGGGEVCEDPRAVLMEAVRQDVAGGQGGERGLNSFSISTQSAMPHSLHIVVKYVQICPKSRRIGCVIPRCKLQCGITKSNL